MAHRRGTFGRGRGISQSQRRKKMWVNVNASLVDAAGGDLFIPALSPAASLTSVFLPSSLNESFRESTILRIRGYVDMPKSTPTALALTTVFAFGIGIVSDEAAGLGSTGAVPNPATITGQDWDGWMFLRTSSQIALDITGTVVDIKAMRKWKSGDSLIFAFGSFTDDPAGTPTSASCLHNFRVLILLP